MLFLNKHIIRSYSMINANWLHKTDGQNIGSDNVHLNYEYQQE